MPPDDHDLYAVLGVTPDATQAQISQAFRRLIRAQHPDLHPHRDPTTLTAAVAAAAILRDPTRRGDYDRRQPRSRDQHLPPPPPPPRRHRFTPDLRAGPVRWHPDPHPHTATTTQRPNAEN
ncbi:MAG TPA: DnaJ domain-containing protein [Pseudonocardiaceae bacterium]|nr:DnaJ domain-containing protein [Pseudonocardiaceae bacterium]